MSATSLILTVLLLLALAFFSVGVMLFWRVHWGQNAIRIKRRLNFIQGDLQVGNPSFIKTRVLSDVELLNTFLEKIPNIQWVDIFLSQAGVAFNVASFGFRLCLLSLATWLFATAMQLSWLATFVFVLLPNFLWLLYLQHQRRQRVLKIEAQLPETLDLMARAMQAGHAFSSALLIVGAEGSPPIRNEFQMTFDEINFGISTEIALHHLTHRVASNDLRFFVIAVLIQLETGGNLTDILKSLAALIRDRQRIAGTVRVLTAEGRLSAWILGLLPFVIAGLMSILNPNFISKLWTDPLGIRMLQVSLTLMAIGIFWMWRMVRVKV